jgi:type II secretory pathway pseudopilin PulG
MSNVLIGIIGVILFIGLALAGALFLGPRFQEATQNSKASAVVQATKQVADAANLYRIQEGTSLGTTELSLLQSRGYVKSVPSFGLGTALVAPDGCVGCADPKAIASVVVLDGTDGSRKLCEAIMKQVGGLPAGQGYSPTGELLLTTITKRDTGCGYDGANYFAYTRF